jgi:hypothetical protein
VETVLEVLTHDGVDYMMTFDELIDEETKRSLTHLSHLDLDLLVFDVVMNQGVDFNHRSEEGEGDSDLPCLHKRQQKVNAFLSQPIQALMSCKGLFPFFKDLAAHVDQFHLIGSVSI